MTQEHDNHHHIPKTHKKVIPHPSEVPSHKHHEVLGLVVEQFINGHYGVKEGSVEVSHMDDAHDRVTFIRTHDPKVEAQDHGIDLSPKED